MKQKPIQDKKSSGTAPERDVVARWYLEQDIATDDEKTVMERSLKYNFTRDLFILIALNIIFVCVWGYLFFRSDTYEWAAGYKLDGITNYMGIVQEDGEHVLVFNPNEQQTTLYSLKELGLDEEYTYMDEIKCYFQYHGMYAEEGYTLMAALPKAEANRIMNVHDGFFMIVYLAFLVISLAIFFLRRRKYISWYRWFNLRMNKFREKYKLWELHPGQAYNTTTSVMLYSQEHPDEFRQDFPLTQLTEEDKKKDRKDRALFAAIIIGIIAVIFIIYAVCNAVKNAHYKRANTKIQTAVEAQVESCLSGEMEALGSSSEYYNAGDMINVMENLFPGEDIYYYMYASKEDDTLTFAFTTEKKTNVYINRYIPVDGKLGAADTYYDLSLSFVSEKMQPDTILNKHTGVLPAEE